MTNQHRRIREGLVVARILAREGYLSAAELVQEIRSPEEMCDFLEYYWKDDKCPLSHQVRKGLAACFHKFTQEEFLDCNKYSTSSIKLRDILFLTHAKPKNIYQEMLFKKIAEDILCS